MGPISALDIFKIGVGPSSSHTMGPWVAARRFIDESGDRALDAVSLSVDLYGSLAKTGRGHGTDLAVQLGLSGCDARTIDVDTIEDRIATIARVKSIAVNGTAIPFNPATDLRFHFDQQLPGHPNAVRFTARLRDGGEHSAVYYSVGGGFVVKEGESADAGVLPPPPMPVTTAEEMLRHCREQRLPISGVAWRNEQAWRTGADIRAGLAAIRDAMLACVHRGCRTEGVLPGGLGVKRRAAEMFRQLTGVDCPAQFAAWRASLAQAPQDFRRVLDAVSCFALAVNEENAAFGRVVTAPTNGAAGVIPAVLMYYELFCEPANDADPTVEPDEPWLRFLLTAAEIGCLFKKRATLSAAMGGCQAEIGVASAMAAAALAEGLGGTPDQATTAAEIAMEHHLGMTCDPIRGLVQVPCIERNSMGAIKAITATQLALQRGEGEACVSLDDVIRTMWNTALDMNDKYKETSEGGLAVAVPVNVSEC